MKHPLCQHNSIFCGIFITFLSSRLELPINKTICYSYSSWCGVCQINTYWTWCDKLACRLELTYPLSHWNDFTVACCSHALHDLGSYVSFKHSNVFISIGLVVYTASGQPPARSVTFLRRVTSHRSSFSARVNLQMISSRRVTPDIIHGIMPTRLLYSATSHAHEMI